MSDHADPIRLTILPNEPIATVVCAMLTEHGIRCTQRITNLAFGGGGEFPSSGIGPREVLVPRAQLDDARRALAQIEASAPE